MLWLLQFPPKNITSCYSAKPVINANTVSHYLHNSLSTVSILILFFFLPPFSLFHSPHPFSFSFSLSFSFFFLPPFEDDALVLLFSKCRMEMTEMPNEKLKGYASFSLSMCFFSIFFTACSLFLLKLSFLSQKASIFISKLHEYASFSLSMCFLFFIFFTACSLFLLKLPFLSQKASIFISKLHECASFSLSMCFFSIFFTCSLFLLKLPFLSQKASIFISKLHECASFSLSMCFFFSLHVHCFF